MQEDFRQMAEELILARKQVRVVAQPSERYKTFDLQAGYQVGLEIQKALERQGYKPIGRKIGFTNRDTWKEFNLNTPIWATVYDRTVVHAGGTVPLLPLEGMTAPRIEPEVVFGLGTSVVGDEYAGRLDKLFECIEWVALGFEIVDSHYLNWEFTAADVVADFGAHAMLVIGEKKELSGKDFHRMEERLRGFQAVLKKDREIVAVGRGENALGSPLAALQYLVKLLERQKWAEPLGAGEVVTTGTLTPLPYIHPGEKWTVEPVGIDLGALKLAFL